MLIYDCLMYISGSALHTFLCLTVDRNCHFHRIVKPYKCAQQHLNISNEIVKAVTWYVDPISSPFVVFIGKVFG